MDDSEMSEQALGYAIEAYPDAEFTVLTVVWEPSAMFGEATAIALADDPDESAREHAEPVLERARSVAAEYDRALDTEVGSGRPVRAIVEAAADFDTLVIGSHDGAIADRLFVGNVAEKVFRRSPVPITVVR